MSHRINLHDGTMVILTIPGFGIMDIVAITAPNNTDAGYGEGCLWRYSNGTSSKLYMNTNTVDSATWTVVGAQS